MCCELEFVAFDQFIREMQALQHRRLAVVLLLCARPHPCHAEYPADAARTAVEQAVGSVTSKHVDDLYSHGAVLLQGALSRYVFNADELKAGAAAIAARLMEEKAVCDASAMNSTSICAAPSIHNGAVGVAPCCPLSIQEHLLPPAAYAVLEARQAADHPLATGDVIAILGGPELPNLTAGGASGNRFWWFVPTGDDTVEDNAFYVDRLFGHSHSRPTLGRNAVLDRASDVHGDSRFG